MSRLHVDTRRLNQILNNIDENTTNFIESVAFSIEREAKIVVHVDTGALMNSIYTETTKSTQKPPEQDYSLPNATRNKVYVGPSMEYAIYEEFGSRSRPGHPYFIPSVERVASQLNQHYRLLLP